MAHPQNRNDTPELRLRCLTEFPPRQGTYPPKDRMAAAIDRTVQLADGGVLRVPEGQPIPVEKFSEAVYLAEAAAHGGKPLLVFEP
jgi:hypothetical protein